MLLAEQEEAKRSIQHGDEDMGSEEALNTLEEGRSSVWSRFRASQFSPAQVQFGSIPPVPSIPSMYRSNTGEDPQQSSIAIELGPSSPGSIQSSHSLAGTNPGPQRAQSSSPRREIDLDILILSLRARAHCLFRP
jgi:hypothetical protein